jgi:hypothetical protein
MTSTLRNFLWPRFKEISARTLDSVPCPKPPCAALYMLTYMLPRRSSCRALRGSAMQSLALLHILLWATKPLLCGCATCLCRAPSYAVQHAVTLTLRAGIVPHRHSSCELHCTARNPSASANAELCVEPPLRTYKAHQAFLPMLPQVRMPAALPGSTPSLMPLGTAGCIRARGGRVAGVTPLHSSRSKAARSAGRVVSAARPRHHCLVRSLSWLALPGIACWNSAGSDQWPLELRGCAVEQHIWPEEADVARRVATSRAHA